jgi:TNF receptor-associated protein 1
MSTISNAYTSNAGNMNTSSFNSIIRQFSSDDKKPEKKKESLEFQAETKQLLDIVTHSLYTEKEVFLRELISNCSDALEKLRHLQVANEGSGSSSSSKQQDPDLPLEIKIETDEVNGTITISDTGIGLTKQEMIDHLGTIAKSGSKAFVNELAEKHSSDAANLDASRGIIGKFGVGFYSAFMVGDKVEVRSK